MKHILFLNRVSQVRILLGALSAGNTASTWANVAKPATCSLLQVPVQHPSLLFVNARELHDT